MALFLVQHAKNMPKEEDPTKGLSPEGKFEMERMAVVAKDKGVVVAKICHSGKKRARQSADLIASVLKPRQGVEERQGLAPLDAVAPVAADLDARQNVMLVGHLPFLEKLVSLLIAGSEERPVFKFQHSAILCLDQEPDSSTWLFRWVLLPKMDVF